MSRDYGKQPPQSCARRRRSDCHLLQLDVLLSRGHPAPSRCDDLDERFFQAREAFSAPRFKALYRIWKQDGDRALAELGSVALYAAVTAAAGQVETLELGHRYGHLSPLINIA